MRRASGRTRGPLLTGVAVLACAATVAPAGAAPGDVDPSFGFGGRVTTAIGEHGDDAAMAVAPDFDGRVVAVGRSGASFAVVRYTATGTLDPTFGSDGIVTTAFGPGLEARAIGVAVSPSGEIVVAGTVRPAFNLGGQEPGDFAVARYDDNGNLDTSFGGDGIVITDAGSNEDAEDVAVQSDGAIVVAGTGDGFVLTRYEADGDLDPTFAGDGIATGSFGVGRFHNARGMALQGDGRIVVAGAVDEDLALARFESDGDLDATFGTGGKVETDIGGGDDEAGDVAVDGGGAVIVAGSAGDDLLVARYEADGDPDLTFGGGDGEVTADLGGSDRAHGVVLMGGGAILAAGWSGTASEGEVHEGAQFALARFEADGDQDATFGGGDGEVLTDVGAGASDGAHGVALQSGRIVAAGTSHPPFASFELDPGVLQDFVVAGYESDGDLDPTFSGDGKVETRIGIGFGDAAAAVAPTSDGGAVAVGRTVDEAGPDDPDFAVVRYRADGTPDPAFAGDGVVTTDFGSDSFDSAHAVAVHPDGRVVVAGTAGGELAVARYEADGDPDPAFSGDGRTTVDLGAGTDEGRAIVIGADGRILVSGGSEAGGLALVRLLPTGGPDTSFSTDGKVTDAAFESFASGTGLAVQPDGAIVTVGTGAFAFVVGRYEPDGDPDVTFGGDGRVVTDLSGQTDVASDVAVQPDGAIVVAGTVGRADTPIAACGGEGGMDVALARYEPDGDLDPGFDGDGVLTTATPGVDEEASALGLQADGALVTAGRASADFGLARYTASGALDVTFGTGGRVTTDFGAGSCDVAADLALGGDRAVAAGFARGAGGSRFALARYVTALPIAPDPDPGPGTPPPAAPPPAAPPPAAPPPPAPAPAPAALMPSAAAPDRSVTAELRAHRRQRVLRRRGVAVTARCPTERCTATATGTLAVQGKRRSRLARVRRVLAAGRRATLTLRLSRSQMRRVRAALRARRRVSASVTVTVTDAAGNRASRRLRIRLVR